MSHTCNKNIGGIGFALSESYFGHCRTRLVANGFTSLGLICVCFYAQSGYLIMAAWALMGCPSAYYIGSNCCTVPLFGPAYHNYCNQLLQSAA